MDLSLWSTYWPGINEEVCGGAGSSRRVTATGELETITPSSLVISERTPDQGYTEACYWEITGDTKTYKGDAEIYIYLDSSTTSKTLVFGGTGR